MDLNPSTPDKFKAGSPVICVAPAPEGEAGFLGRRGTVLTQRIWRDTVEAGTQYCYPVLFDGEARVMWCLEWELLPVVDSEATNAEHDICADSAPKTKIAGVSHGV